MIKEKVSILKFSAIKFFFWKVSHLECYTLYFYSILAACRAFEEKKKEDGRISMDSIQGLKTVPRF